MKKEHVCEQIIGFKVVMTKKLAFNKKLYYPGTTGIVKSVANGEVKILVENELVVTRPENIELVLSPEEKFQFEIKMELKEIKEMLNVVIDKIDRI